MVVRTTVKEFYPDKYSNHHDRAMLLVEKRNANPSLLLSLDNQLLVKRYQKDSEKRNRTMLLVK